MSRVQLALNVSNLDTAIAFYTTLFGTEPAKVRAQAYDLVINGEECAGGTIRIHDSATQGKVFRLLGLTPEQAEEKFGFLLSALKNGAPPHGGIDRHPDADRLERAHFARSSAERIGRCLSKRLKPANS